MQCTLYTTHRYRGIDAETFDFNFVLRAFSHVTVFYHVQYALCVQEILLKFISGKKT